MTRTLARLEKAGWISKLSGTDKREKKIFLTDLAHKQYEVWLEAVQACESNVLNNISEEERDLMQKIIERMNNNL